MTYGRPTTCRHGGELFGGGCGAPALERALVGCEGDWDWCPAHLVEIRARRRQGVAEAAVERKAPRVWTRAKADAMR